MKFSIIVPCYNESSNIDKLVSTLMSFPNKYNVEFILVENGSKDNSREIFELNKNINKNNIKSVYVDENKGYGFGIIQGLKKATGDYVGWIHADLQFNPLDLISFFDFIETNKLNNKYFMKGKRKNRSLIENIFTFGMGVVDTIIFRKNMHDVMSMPVIFNKEMLSEIDKFPFDFSIDIYTYALANKLNYKIKHLPVIIIERENGVSSWNTGLSSRIKQSKKMFDASIKVNKEMRNK